MNSVNASRALPVSLVRNLRRHLPGGGLIYLSAPERRPTNARRDASIRKARAAGASIPDLAKTKNLSESRVWEICRGLHPDRHPRTRRSS